MAQTIIHGERVAWDGARAIVATLDHDGLYEWLSDRLGELLGAAYRQSLSDSRRRIETAQRADMTLVESGIWRALLQDVLRSRPELTGPVLSLVEQTNRLLFDVQWSERLA